MFAGALFPFLFITIACGALSGFHALISSGTTPKMLEKEGQMRLIGYGGMLTESFVAIIALLTASILDQHLYFVLNAPPPRPAARRPAPRTTSTDSGYREIRPAQTRSPRLPRAWAHTRSCRAPAAHKRWHSACRRS
ncbi:carbon starvation CstA family protein [Mycobacterium ulcerans str. Harvey]|uniref:Carbon starvation CstA family protein n=1 Tax=Mycobacterium ulcerans str. Harvey TaxID=1299332 RepID=A0ABN0QKW0_MYCUL|nr:carbon starvation CstA family protein [Mycobacterium ulcerans str. Harvey]